MRSRLPIAAAIVALFAVAALLALFWFKGNDYDIAGNGEIKQPQKNMSLVVDEARALLKASRPLVYQNAGKNVPTARKEIAIAAYDTRDNKISEYRYWLANDAQPDQNGALILESVTPNSPRVRLVWRNSYNSYYEFVDRPELIIVGNKYLVDREYLPEQGLMPSVNPNSSSNYSLIYIPYSAQLHTPDLIKSGVAYVDSIIDQAISDLDRRSLKSKNTPEKLVTESVPRSLIQSIILTEHVDSTQLAFADDGGRRLAERILIILGANREWAYRYVNSPAGANGLAQFIEPTYYVMANQYADAQLISDFRLGMADHVNAVKAMYLYFDFHIDYLRRTVKSENLPNGVTSDMLAAAYNGGGGRVVKALNEQGQLWAKSGILHPETEDYVAKFQTLAQLNLFSK